jgi:sialidase-1
MMEGRQAAEGVDYVAIAPATAAHPRNDSATLAELADGSLLMAWIQMHASASGGHDEAPSSIASMRSTDGGRHWGEPRIEVAPGSGDLNVYNPSLIALPDGEVLFFYLKYHHLVWNEPLQASGLIRRSRDGGRTWSEPSALWDHQPRGGANHTFTRLAAGRLLKSVEHVPVWGAFPKCVSSSGAYLSDDGGRTWREPGCWVTLPLRGTMESHVAETHGGLLVMAMRNQLGSVFLSRSRDAGLTWSKPQTSGLSCGESMPSLTRIPTTGDLLLIWNNSEFDPKFDHQGRRSPLASAISRDGGATWIHRKLIEDDPAIEFSNVACSFTRAGKAIVTYFTSRMANPDPPGKLGRAAMSLKGAIVDLDWFYAS